MLCRAGAEAGSPFSPSLTVKGAEGKRRKKAKRPPAGTALPPLPPSRLEMLGARCQQPHAMAAPPPRRPAPPSPPPRGAGPVSPPPNPARPSPGEIRYILSGLPSGEAGLPPAPQGVRGPLRRPLVRRAVFAGPELPPAPRSSRRPLRYRWVRRAGIASPATAGAGDQPPPSPRGQEH